MKHPSITRERNHNMINRRIVSGVALVAMMFIGAGVSAQDPNHVVNAGSGAA